MRTHNAMVTVTQLYHFFFTRHSVCALAICYITVQLPVIKHTVPIPLKKSDEKRFALTGNKIVSLLLSCCYTWTRNCPLCIRFAQWPLWYTSIEATERNQIMLYTSYENVIWKTQGSPDNNLMASKKIYVRKCNYCLTLILNKLLECM